MAFPIIPKKRSGASGYPTTLEVGELAVNTLDGSMYLGGDSAVMLLNGPVAAGTTVTEHTGDGTTTAFTFAGYNGTEDGGYIVSVGGIDQPPSKYSITNTAGGTITFVDAPVSGELISIRALVAGSGGGSGDATSLQGRAIATTAPTAGQVLAWNATTSKWEPTSINGSVTFNTAGTHEWVVPAWVRWVYVNGAAGAGSAGTGTSGSFGELGQSAYWDNGTPIAATTGAAGANGIAEDGQNGASITITAISIALNGGAKGLAGTFGYGGGGSGGGGFGNPSDENYLPPANGGNGAGPFGGQGGFIDGTPGAGGGTASSGSGAQGGAGANGGGTGGNSGGSGGGGGGGDERSGGGGGAGSPGSIQGYPGQGGAGIPGTAGTAGDTIAQAIDLSSVAGTTISIVIGAGAGSPSITFTY
jgi:hypothetical protein